MQSLLFDSTLNAALLSARIAVSEAIKYLGKEPKDGTPAIKSLDSDRLYL